MSRANLLEIILNTDTFIPQNFIDDVKTYLPDSLSIESFIEYCQKPLRRSVRVNTLKMTINEFKQYCSTNNWKIEAVPWCDTGFWLERSAEEEETLPLGSTDIHLSGGIYVQEASSMLPPMALKSSLKEDDIVLDMAAAPGSKTSQIATMMSNQGILVANELSSSRLKVLAANMKRMGVHNCALSHFDGAVFGDYMFECFDNIQLDAPCSGEGTVRKDADALKNWSVESNIDIANVQKQLIKSAFFALKPGGSLIYSTCTLTPVENQAVCQYLLDQFGDNIEIEPLNTLFENADKACTTEGYLHVWPQVFDSEGFFIAKFKKLKSVDNPNLKTKKGAFPFSSAGKKLTQAFMSAIKKQFGIKSLPGELTVRDKELWLFPERFSEIENKIKYSRIGIKLGTTHKNGVRLEHEFATALGKHAENNTYALTQSQAADYYQGKDIRLETVSNHSGEVILTLCGAPIGLGKWQKNKIKNSLPRDLVMNNRVIEWSR